MNARYLSARMCAALPLVLSLLVTPRPAIAEPHVLLHTERSLVMRVRDLSGDGDRDVVFFHPDVRGQFDGPGRAIVRTWRNQLLADFRAEGQAEVWALGAAHPADVDNNQRVNNDDLAALLQRAGRAPTPGAPGDLNRDGVVDQVDAGILMGALEALDGAGWVRHDQSWPSAFDPQLEGGERAENCWAWAPGDGGFWLCGPGQGRPGPDDPDGGDNDDNTPLGPDDGGGGGGGPGDDDGGGGDDDEPDDPVNCAEVTVTIGTFEGYLPVRDRAETWVTFSAATTGPDGTFFWTVGDASSAVEGGPNFSVAVNEGGMLAVSVRFVASNGCEAFDSIDVPVCSFDLAIDIDENGHIDESDVEAEAAPPGAILLANNFDEDGDGVEGFADGFDWSPLIEQDNSDDTTTFVPITLHVSGVESGNARIRFDYPASDPVALTIGDDGWTLPPGRIRLWRVDGSQTRNSDLLIDGGDYIAPGEYALSDLGIFGPDDVTLYVESIRESALEGDIVIAAAVSADEESGWVSSDVVVGTGVRMTIAGASIGENELREPAPLVATHLYPADAPPPAGMTAGPWWIFQMRISDPRPGPRQTRLGPTWLPLSYNTIDRRWESSYFWIWWPTNPNATEGRPNAVMVPVLDWPPVLEWEYLVADSGPRNETALKKLRAVAVETMPVEQRLVAEAVEAVTAEMESEGWLRRNFSDDGEYGKEVHRRVTARVAGQPNVYSEVWLRDDTLEVVCVGSPPGNRTGLGELDIVFTRDGFTPTIGQPWDTSRVAWASDVKTSAAGRLMHTDQKNFYDRAAGANKWSVQTPRRMCGAAGWIDHPRGGKTYRILGFIGMGATALAFSNVGRYDDDLDAMIAAWEDAIEYRNDYHNREIYFYFFVGEFRDYMANFVSDTTAIDSLSFIAFWDYLGTEPTGN